MPLKLFYLTSTSIKATWNELKKPRALLSNRTNRGQLKSPSSARWWAPVHKSPKPWPSYTFYVHPTNVKACNSSNNSFLSSRITRSTMTLSSWSSSSLLTSTNPLKIGPENSDNSSSWTSSSSSDNSTTRTSMMTRSSRGSKWMLTYCSNSLARLKKMDCLISRHILSVSKGKCLSSRLKTISPKIRF